MTIKDFKLRFSLKKLWSIFFLSFSFFFFLKTAAPTYFLLNNIYLSKIQTYFFCLVFLFCYKIYRFSLSIALFIFFILIALLEFFHSNLNPATVNNLLNDDFIYLSSSYIIIIIILKKIKKMESILNIVRLNALYMLIALNILLFFNPELANTRFAFFSVSLLFLSSYSYHFKLDRTTFLCAILTLLIINNCESRASSLIFSVITMCYFLFSLNTSKKLVSFLLFIFSIYNIFLIHSFNSKINNYLLVKRNETAYSIKRNTTLFQMIQSAKISSNEEILNDERVIMVNDKNVSMLIRFEHIKRVIIETIINPLGRGLIYSRKFDFNNLTPNTSTLFVFINAYGIFFIFPFIYLLFSYYKKDPRNNIILSIPLLVNILFISNISFFSIFIFLLGFK
jgi:hypothetical protein